MRMNLWKWWKDRRKQKQALKQQHDLLQTWQWVERLFQCGMLSFDDKSHRLYIMQSLAVLLMAKGVEGWVNSIHAIYQYTYWRTSQKLWEEFMQKEELAALREAIDKNPKLLRADIERIKWSKRQSIDFSDMQPPKVEPFEFFIIPDSTEAAVEPLAIGTYDPNTEEMEIATWNEVKSLLHI